MLLYAEILVAICCVNGAYLCKYYHVIMKATDFIEVIDNKNMKLYFVLVLSKTECRSLKIAKNMACS